MKECRRAPRTTEAGGGHQETQQKGSLDHVHLHVDILHCRAGIATRQTGESRVARASARPSAGAWRQGVVPFLSEGLRARTRREEGRPI